MIAEAVLAVEFGASLEDIAGTVHGRPTCVRPIGSGDGRAQVIV